MQNCFTGKLYINGSAKPLLSNIFFEFDRLSFHLLESDDVFEASYSKLEIGLGGFENRSVEIKSVDTNGKILYSLIDENQKDDFLDACSKIRNLIKPGMLEKINSQENKTKLIEIAYCSHSFICIFIILVIITLIYKHFF